MSVTLKSLAIATARLEGAPTPEMIGIRGESEKSHIQNITFEDITIGDEKLESLTQMHINEFVHNVTIR